LRVLMTADAVGGVWTYALDLARGLAGQGARVTLAVLGPPPRPAQQAQAMAVPGLELVQTGLELDWTAPGPEAVRAAAAGIRDLAGGADLVHLNSPALAGFEGFDAPVVAACHSCVATWWAAVRGGPLPSDFQWRRDLAALGLLAADRLVAPSAAFAAATAEAYGLRRPPRTVHNGRAPAALGAPSGEVFVFTAGRLWDEGKNLATLDRAAARLPVPVLAAGPLEGPNGARVALPHLHTPGELDGPGMAAHLAAAPVFASAARYEPFGLATLEAAQAGCPLVLSDIPSFREIWGEAAEFVSPDDDAGFARAIRALLADPLLRRRRGQAARARAARYSVQAMVEGTLRLYRELLPASREVLA
jgi:glycosyltransferase involved in cell wall biosynthesis